METIEVTAKTLDEAIQKALLHLKVGRDDVNIEVLSEEKKGLFGLMGAKPAKIRATVIKKENV
ncbi:MAG: Jag N-terminal domain-containing protein [Candidatus Omnitrophota bacterium]